MVSRLARKHVKVVLSGDGGDELYWGYPSRFGSAIAQARYFGWPRPARVAAIAARRTLDRGAATRDVLAYPSIGRLYQRKHTLSPRPISPRSSRRSRRRRRRSVRSSSTGPNRDGTAQWVRWNEFRIHLARVLAKVDRASMFHSLEVRVPLLDRDVIDVAWRTDWATCLDLGSRVGKQVLRARSRAGSVTRPPASVGSRCRCTSGSRDRCGRCCTSSSSSAASSAGSRSTARRCVASSQQLVAGDRSKAWGLWMLPVAGAVGHVRMERGREDRTRRESFSVDVGDVHLQPGSRAARGWHRRDRVRERHDNDAELFADFDGVRLRRPDRASGGDDANVRIAHVAPRTARTRGVACRAGALRSRCVARCARAPGAAVRRVRYRASRVQRARGRVARCAAVAQAREARRELPRCRTSDHAARRARARDAARRPVRDGRSRALRVGRHAADVRAATGSIPTRHSSIVPRSTCAGSGAPRLTSFATAGRTACCRPAGCTGRRASSSRCLQFASSSMPAAPVIYEIIGAGPEEERLRFAVNDLGLGATRPRSPGVARPRRFARHSKRRTSTCSRASARASATRRSRRWRWKCPSSRRPPVA